MCPGLSSLLYRCGTQFGKRLQPQRMCVFVDKSQQLHHSKMCIDNKTGVKYYMYFYSMYLTVDLVGTVIILILRVEHEIIFQFHNCEDVETVWGGGGSETVTTAEAGQFHFRNLVEPGRARSFVFSGQIPVIYFS